jgi:hypothetical protein
MKDDDVKRWPHGQVSWGQGVCMVVCFGLDDVERGGHQYDFPRASQSSPVFLYFVTTRLDSTRLPHSTTK